MAIIKNIETQFGLTIENAYLRIGSLELGKNLISFSLKSYADKDKPFFNEQYLSCPYNIDGDNPFIQAYEYLKTLEEFKDAEDC